MFKLALAPFLTLALCLKDGDAIYCWMCSTELNSGCNDPFLLGQLNDTSRTSEIMCEAYNVPYTYISARKPACIKRKLLRNDEVIITRGCVWKDISDFSINCMNSLSGQEVNQFCETCEQEECNSAPSISMTLVIFVPFGLFFSKINMFTV